jgi:hypothetical protein
VLALGVSYVLGGFAHSTRRGAHQRGERDGGQPKEGLGSGKGPLKGA